MKTGSYKTKLLSILLSASLLICWVILVDKAPEAEASSVVSSLQELAMIPEARSDLKALNDLPNYEINVDINLSHQTPSFEAKETITYTNNEGVDIENLYLRLYPNGNKIYGNGSIKIGKVSIANEEVKPRWEVGRTALKVPLEEHLKPNKQISIEVEFYGTVPTNFEGQGFNYGIYNYSQGVMTLANWYPMLAVYDCQGWNLDPVYGWGDPVYSDMALYEVYVTAPAETRVVATGLRVPGMSSQNGDTASHFYVSGPTRDFFIALSKDLRVTSKKIGNTVVNSHFLPKSPTNGQSALTVSTKALQIFNRLFGVYPYRELDVLVLPLPFSGGVEYPGLVLLSDNLDPDTITFHSVTAHEVAHQWWYGVVGSDVIQEPWLDEALVTYSSALYIEKNLGEAYLQHVLEDWQRRYEQTRAEGIKAPIASSVTAFTNNSDYAPIVYYGGALFYHKLRKSIGDQAFFKSLKEYYQKFKYKLATTHELTALFEEVSGQKLDYLYRKWLFTSCNQH